MTHRHSQQALDTYSAQDFEDAGFPDWVRGRVSEIAMHERTHVNLLSAALGGSSVAACEYSLYVHRALCSFLLRHIVHTLLSGNS